MAEQKQIVVRNRKLVITPLGSVSTSKPQIVINKNNKITFLKGEKSKELFGNIKLAQAKTLFKEDIIYESSPGDFLKGLPHKVTLINRLNMITNCSRTVAKFTNPSDGTVAYEKTSDSVTRLIGQKNYDLLFSVLCSVISLELKVRGIMALLLTSQFDNQTCQTDIKLESNIKTTESIEKNCQTDENCMDLISKMKQKKRIRRAGLTPYVVKDVPEKKVKKVIVHPDNIKKNIHKKIENKNVETTEKLEELTDLQLSDESNEGSIGNLSSFSGYSNENLLFPKKILEMIGQFTKNEINASASVVKVKHEDPLHIVTPEILKTIPSKAEREKLLWTQLYYDWKFCLQPDQDGYLPIHHAVLNGDLDLLRRHCLVLRNRQESLDIPGGNLTALQMSMFQDMEPYTAMLLEYGADPLLTDDDHRSCLHLATEVMSDHLKIVIHYCQNNAREILQDHDELWKPSYESKSDEELGTILLDHMCQMVDDQGYTSLMLASKMGNYTYVRQLIEASPASVNIQNPNSGSTALFIAIEEACLDAANRANKSKVADHFSKTISILLENGADPAIENLQGMNVHELVSETNNGELSILVCSNLVKKNTSGDKSIDSYMLVKNKNGEIDVTDIKNKDVKTTKRKNNKNDKKESNKTSSGKSMPTVDKTKAGATDKNKLIILENIAITQTSGLLVKDIKSLINPVVTLGPKDKLVTVKHMTFDTKNIGGSNPGTSVVENACVNALDNMVEHLEKKSDIVTLKDENVSNMSPAKKNTSLKGTVVKMEDGEPEKKKSKVSLK